jgi:hypothetical protein
VALFVEGGGGGFAEGVGTDPGEFVRGGWFGGFVDLGAEGWGVVEVDAVGLDWVDDELVVDFDAAGFDEFDSGLGPVEGLGDLLARHTGFAAEGSKSEAQVAAGGAADG